MKAKFFFAIVTFLIVKSSLCQTNASNKIDTINSSAVYIKGIENSYHRKISTGIITGNFTSGGNKIASRIGTEITYDFSKRFSLVGNYLSKISNEPFQEKDYAAGIRYNTGRSNLNFFVETLVNLNIRKEMIDINTSLSNSSVGVVFGAGSELKLFNNFSGMLKTSLYKFNKPGTSMGVFAGLKYRF